MIYARSVPPLHDPDVGWACYLILSTIHCNIIGDVEYIFMLSVCVNLRHTENLAASLLNKDTRIMLELKMGYI